MSQSYAHGLTSPTETQLNAARINLIAVAAIACGVFMSGFVINEPSPYELVMVPVMGVAFLCGLRLSSITMIPLSLFVVILVGGLLTFTQIRDYSVAPMYYAVTGFLALTTVFFAAAIEAKPSLLRPIFFAYVLAAMGTGALGTLGYLGLLPGGEIFTLYGRAKGAFKDPNVFGPYLVLPSLYLLYRMVVGKMSDIIRFSPFFLFIMLALFLSFSRAAWGLMVFCSLMLVMLLFVSSTDQKFRVKIILASIAATVLLVIALIIALQIPAISDIFVQRAKVVQDYDGARVGRFARHAIGFWLALEKPLGIGPLEFGQIYGEDTHAMWLKALMDYSWLGFFGWLTLFAWTLAAGFKILLRPRPWQPYLLCAWIVFLGHVLTGIVIDTDKWRHVYLIIGIIWGCVGLEAKHQRNRIGNFRQQ